MSEFITKDGQFWLDGQPQLIQAGEFHYFRTPRDQWPQRLGLLKGAGFNAVATYIPWLWHQWEEDQSDFTGQSHPMRNLAGYLDLAADMGFFIIARPGPYIMAETINEGIPPWVFEKYPQAALISQDNKVQNVASYLQADFLAAVKKWYKAIFAVLTPRQVTRGGKIILVQLDNEMGMIQWVRNIMDINPDTMSKFASFLTGYYGNDLARRYPVDRLTEFLVDGLSNPHESYSAAIVEDYRLFYREYLREYAEFLKAEAVLNGMEVPPVINIHGFANGGKTFPIGLSQLIKVMGIEGMVSATDVYPGFIGEGNFHQLLLVNEMTRVLQNKQQPLFSVEFQAGGNQDHSNGQSSLNDLHSRLCISSGMRGLNHYLFCDGENDPVLSPVKRHDWGHPVRKDGTLRNHYHRYPRLSKALQCYGRDLILSSQHTVTTIGFLSDHFMTEVSNPSTQEAVKIITRQRDNLLFDLIARGLALTHRPFNAVEISREKLDLSRIPLCWAMMEKQCDATTQQRLVDYIQAGGKLILAGRMCTEEFDHRACTILKDAIGIATIQDDAPFVSKDISVFQYRDVPVTFVETYTGRFDEVFASDGVGATIGFIKSIGGGRVMMLGASMTAETLDDVGVVEQMAMQMGCPPLFQTQNWVDVRISEGENGSFLFVSNYQDDPVETTILCEEKDLFGGHFVSLPARRGVILPIEWQLRPGIFIHYVTAEIMEIAEDESSLTIHASQDEFFAEMTISGYRGDVAVSETIQKSAKDQRICIHGKNGVIVLSKVG